MSERRKQLIDVGRYLQLDTKDAPPYLMLRDHQGRIVVMDRADITPLIEALQQFVASGRGREA